MIQNTRIEISPVMLRNAFNKRGIKLSSASLKMGYADNYLNVICDRGYITRPSMILINQLFGIEESEISTPKIDTVEVVQNEGMNKIELYNTIYEAVKNAMRDALNDKGGN